MNIVFRITVEEIKLFLILKLFTNNKHILIRQYKLSLIINGQ